MNNLVGYIVDMKESHLCSICKMPYPLCDFADNPTASNGKRTFCKKCESDKRKARLQKRKKQKESDWWNNL